MGRYLLKLLDFLVDHWDQIAWLVPGVALLSAWLFGWWAGLSALAPVEIVIIAMTAVATGLAILTLLPQYLRQRFPRPFAVSIHDMLRNETAHAENIQLNTYIINRSFQNRIVLDFAICFRSKDGRERWSLQPILDNITPGLGPQEHSKGKITFNVGREDEFIPIKPNTENLHISNHKRKKKTVVNSDHGIYLQVVDRISGRWIRFRVPGSYPPRFFVL